jgi:hypothetical protein
MINSLHAEKNNFELNGLMKGEKLHVSIEIIHKIILPNSIRTVKDLEKMNNSPASIFNVSIVLSYIEEQVLSAILYLEISLIIEFPYLLAFVSLMYRCEDLRR